MCSIFYRHTKYRLASCDPVDLMVRHISVICCWNCWNGLTTLICCHHASGFEWKGPKRQWNIINIFKAARTVWAYHTKGIHTTLHTHKHTHTYTDVFTYGWCSCLCNWNECASALHSPRFHSTSIKVGVAYTYTSNSVYHRNEISANVDHLKTTHTRSLMKITVATAPTTKKGIYDTYFISI